MRQIIYDTETTGTEPARGDRIIEIGMVEVLDFLPTGREYHTFINPERLIPLDAQRIHGITDAHVADAPIFADVADAILEFVGDADMVAHNAEFDRGFLNMELRRLNRAEIEISRSIDTVAIARKKYPGAPASLDALCRRFNIDLSTREKHGALIDARLLANVYLELNGGAERRLDLYSGSQTAQTQDGVFQAAAKPSYPPRPRALAARLSADEQERHAAFVARLAGGGLWG